jgi:hypothetical protein
MVGCDIPWRERMALMRVSAWASETAGAQKKGLFGVRKKVARIVTCWKAGVDAMGKCWGARTMQSRTREMSGEVQVVGNTA